MMTARLLTLLAGALLMLAPAFADEAPPEDKTGLSPERPVADAERAVQQDPVDAAPEQGEEPNAEGMAALGFELPPALEEFIERLEGSLKHEPVRSGSDDATSAQAEDAPAPEAVPVQAPVRSDSGDDHVEPATGETPLLPATAADDPEAPPVPDVMPIQPAGQDDEDDLIEPAASGGEEQDAVPAEPSEPVSDQPSEPSPVDADSVPAGTAAGDAASWGPPPPDPAANEFGTIPISLLGSDIAPGVRERLHWTTGQSFSGSVMETPVVVVHGKRRGPRLCLTGGVHGDELNGIEVVRRVAYRVEPQNLSGTVIAVPIVNLLGFSRGSRYLPDRRDLNRFFPGSPYGSSASRIANSFFDAIINQCDALVDIHTGSLDRANLPQVRGDLTNPAILEFTRGFGATAVLHSPGSPGMLRYAASVRGIPAVTFEIGGPLRLQPEEIEHGVQAIETLLNKMGMIEQRRRWREPQAVFYESRWVRVDHGGMLFSEVALGDRVQRGQRLGRVIDPVSNRGADVVASEAGRIIGMALNQLVLPGFAAYNVGIAASEEQIVIDAAQDAAPDDERYLENDQLDDDQRLLEEGDRVPDESLEQSRRRDGDGGRH